MSFHSDSNYLFNKSEKEKRRPSVLIDKDALCEYTLALYVLRKRCEKSVFNHSTACCFIKTQEEEQEEEQKRKRKRS